MNDAHEPHLQDTLLQEQFTILTKYMPTMYVVVVVATGMLAYLVSEVAPLWLVGSIFGALATVSAVRARHWRRLATSGYKLSPEQTRKAINVTTTIGVGLAFAFAVCALFATREASVTAQILATLCVWGAAVFCSFSLSVLPRTAGAVLIAAAAPLIVAMVWTGDVVMLRVAPVIALVTAALLYLIRENYRNFVEIVASRASVEVLRGEATALALTDALTGLPNRRCFDLKLKEQTKKGGQVYVAMLDLDGFKPVNDVYGHSVGDVFLKEAGARIARAVGDWGLIARMGGDEFAILMTGLARPESAIAIAQAAIDEIDAPFQHGSISVSMRASAGVAAQCENGDVARLVERADIALYRAKTTGRGQVVLFSDALEENAQTRARIESGLRIAIAQDALTLHFQPIIQIVTGELMGFEALARWTHPELGEISPSVFVPMAEQLGLIEKMSAGLLVKAATAAASWPNALTLSFNLSAAQLISPSAGLGIIATLAECGLEPHRFEAEVTETAIMTDIEAARRTIAHLKQAGARVSLDDFGTGYASFSQLRDLPFDKLKIDKSFVDVVCHDRKSANVVGAIIGMCGHLDLKCVAEGIESEEQLQALAELGCDKGQGFLISRPVPLEGVAAVIAAHMPPLAKTA
ncbi:MAG: EAL domain-containing protein [Hyphomicrobiales bacterium]|nr:EAL domain-containing protein [Hyphomicrobiales bacterium]